MRRHSFVKDRLDMRPFFEDGSQSLPNPGIFVIIAAKYYCIKSVGVLRRQMAG